MTVKGTAPPLLSDHSDGSGGPTAAPGLHIKYRKPSGRRTWPVSISPQDKTGFLQELAVAVPGVKIVEKGLEE